MNDPIQDEIARRLGHDVEAVTPVLETVVQRIRQQVEHYGYARLSGLGTFRHQDGELYFEPDPALAESINSRFAGLAELVLEPGTPVIDDLEGPSPDEEATDDPASIDETVLSVHDPSLPDGDLEPSRDEEAIAGADGETVAADDEPVGVDDALVGVDDEPAGADEETSDLPPFDEAPSGTPDEAQAEFVEAPGHLDDKVDHTDDVVEAAEEADLPSHGSDEEDETDAMDDPPHASDEDASDAEDALPAPVHSYDEEDDDEAVWNDLRGTADEHPLGPESEPDYEDADYAVLGESAAQARQGEEWDEAADIVDEQDDEADSESDRPTIAWAPLGRPESEADGAGTSGIDPSEEDAPGDSGHEPTDDDPELAPAGETDHENEADTRSKGHAPDRPAYPHGMRADGPVRTVNPPTRRSRKGRDPKALWFGVAVIVIVVAAAVAYLVLPDLPTGPQQENIAQAPTTEETPPATVPDTTAAASEEPAVEPAPPPSTPLRAEEGIDRAAGGFTIVVFSETDPTLANEAAERYQAEGFRTSVLSYQEGGGTRYRVGVGQFDTIEAANDARADLAGSELPDDAWVRRI